MNMDRTVSVTFFRPPGNGQRGTMRFYPLIPLAILGAAIAQVRPVPEFEVASIKRSLNSSEESQVNSIGGKLIATNITVRELIRFAFGVKDYQIEHLPGWAADEKYAIAAETAGISRRLGYGDLQSL